jgi:hypothetical protein
MSFRPEGEIYFGPIHYAPDDGLCPSLRALEHLREIIPASDYRAQVSQNDYTE